jgi:cytochrome c1
VYDWLKDPKNYAEHARMPNLRLSDEEARDITAFLMAQGKDYPQEITKRSGTLAKKVNPKDQQLIQHGKKIMGERGCYACHEVKGFDGFERIGPELTKQALKEPFELDFYRRNRQKGLGGPP